MLKQTGVHPPHRPSPTANNSSRSCAHVHVSIFRALVRRYDGCDDLACNDAHGDLGVEEMTAASSLRKLVASGIAEKTFLGRDGGMDQTLFQLVHCELTTG